MATPDSEEHRVTEFVTLAHGSGGKAAHDLVTRFFLPYFDNPILRALDDQGVFGVKGGGSLSRQTLMWSIRSFFAVGTSGDLRYAAP